MTYDALIIGGRAAGGSLAVLLAQRGYRVLVVDRDRFPSDTMSTHFMHRPSCRCWISLVCSPSLVDTLGFRRLTRTRIYLGDCIFEATDGSRRLRLRASTAARCARQPSRRAGERTRS